MIVTPDALAAIQRLIDFVERDTVSGLFNRRTIRTKDELRLLLLSRSPMMEPPRRAE